MGNSILPSMAKEAGETLSVRRQLKSFKPAYDTVVVRPETHADRTDGGIILPGNVSNMCCTGKVVAIGPGGYDGHGNLIPPPCKVGDRVLFDYTMQFVKVKMDFGDGPEELHVVDQGAIHGVLEYEESPAKE